MDSTDYSQEKNENQDSSMDEGVAIVTEKTKERKVIEINGIIIDKFLASDDLNECVDFLLRKEKVDMKKNGHKVIRHNSSAKAKEK